MNDKQLKEFKLLEDKAKVFSDARQLMLQTVASKLSKFPFHKNDVGAVNYDGEKYVLVKRPEYGPDSPSKRGEEFLERTFSFEQSPFSTAFDVLSFARELVRNVDTHESFYQKKISQADLEELINALSGANKHGVILSWERTEHDTAVAAFSRPVSEMGLPEKYFSEELPVAMLFEMSFEGTQNPHKIAFYYPSTGEMNVDTPAWGASEVRQLPFKNLNEKDVIDWLTAQYAGATVVAQKVVEETKDRKSVPITCCEMTCGKQAEFEIFDKLDPDPYSSNTFACTDHVGELLGNRMDLVIPPGTHKEWRVIYLEEEERVTLV